MIDLIATAQRCQGVTMAADKLLRRLRRMRAALRRMLRAVKIVPFAKTVNILYIQCELCLIILIELIPSFLQLYSGHSC